MLISVYTDGSCNNTKGHPRKGEGSYGYVITAKVNGTNRKREYSSGKYLSTTSNRMELKAIIKALNSIDPGHNIDFYSDSKYCMDGINSWLENWIKRGKLDKMENPGLWRTFLKAKNKHIDGGSTLNFTWVRGHNNNQLNEIADKLAQKGRYTTEGGVHCKDNN